VAQKRLRQRARNAAALAGAPRAALPSRERSSAWRAALLALALARRDLELLQTQHWQSGYDAQRQHWQRIR